MSEQSRFKIARKWRITDKSTLIMLLAAFIPLVVADFYLIGQAAKMRSHLETTLKDYSDRTTVELVAISGQDARALMREIAGQSVRRAEASLQAAATQTKILAGLMTSIYSNPDRYGPRAVSEPDAGQTGLAVQLTYSPNVYDHREIRSEISLAASIQEYLLRLCENYPVFNGVVVASANGFSLEADRFSALKFENGTLKGIEAREQPWYVKAWAQSGLVLTDVGEPPAGATASVWVAAPFYLASDFAGVAGVNYSLAELAALVREKKLTERGFSFTVNESGQVTMTARTEGVLSIPALGPRVDLRQAPNAGLAGLISRMAAGQRGEAQVNIDGREYLVVFEPVPSIKWSLAVALDMDEVLAPARRTGETLDKLGLLGRGYYGGEQRSTMIFLLVWHLVVIGAVVFASRFLARKLTRTLTVISAWAAGIGQGHLDTPLKLKTGDEIENLAESLEQMRHNLAAHIEREVQVKADRERQESEALVARKVQRNLLPASMPSGLSGLELAGELIPSRQVGGDFYDYFEAGPGRLALVAGDGSDKGAGGVMYMALVKALIRARARLESSPAQVLGQVNRSLDPAEGGGLFASVFLAFVEPATGRLVYANAGHRPPLVARSGIKMGGPFDFSPAEPSLPHQGYGGAWPQWGFERLETEPGLVLGVDPGFVYADYETRLEAGTWLVITSDGVTETRNPEGELYSEAGLKKSLNQALKLDPSPAELIRDVEREARIFAKGAEQTDDLTLLALRYGKIES